LRVLWFGWGKRALESILLLVLMAPFLRYKIDFSLPSLVGIWLFPVAGQGVFGHCPEIFGRDGRHAA